MIIQAPNNNISERKYIIDVLFSEFLGVKYDIEFKNIDFYKIILKDKSIEISDVFFNKFQKELSYLKKENIPQNVFFLENQFTTEADIPVLYGNGDIDIFENQIKCGIDIFASSFFMLTRWEEYVLQEKDKHSRTLDKLQLSVKYKFNERPIVNEYVEMLRNMLAHLGFEIDNKHKYKLKVTHDIDLFARYDKFSKVVKAIVGDIIKRKSLKKAINTFQSYLKIKKGKLKDPYDTFDYLMDLSEKAGLKSYFYFIPAMLGEEDAQYNISNEVVIAKMQRINKRGHIIGVHGAYRSYKNKELFQKELQRFPKEIKIIEGRQHFLRFENPTTWQMHEEVGLQFDSTIGFINNVGFRSGTCYEYHIFNILTRKKLNLKEHPLIVMEQALIKKYPDKDNFYNKIIELKDTVKKYKGTFVVLWHNNNFNVMEWNNFKGIYENLLY